MARSIRKRPAAFLDLVQAGAYIGRDSLDAELRFYDAAERTFEQLLEAPRVGHPWIVRTVADTDLRVCPVRGFPNWLVFYRPTDAGIEVVRVLHGARDIDALSDEIAGPDDSEP
jgi:toxin ParE1/3/4